MGYEEHTAVLRKVLAVQRTEKFCELQVKHSSTPRPAYGFVKGVLSLGLTMLQGDMLQHWSGKPHLYV